LFVFVAWFVEIEIIIRRQREDRQDRFLGAFFFSFLVSLSLFLTRYFLDASFYYDRALGVLVVLSFFSLSRDLDLSLSLSLFREQVRFDG